MARALLATLIGDSLLLLFCGFLQAQQPTGSITGMVTDPSGAIIPGAAITVTDKATDATIKLTTTQAGIYTASGLLPGAYKVRVEASGFKTTVVDLTVEVGRVTPADIRLDLGASAETVTVQAHAALVNPVQTTLEGIVTDGLIRNLPLNGRNFLDLGQLEPGVQLQDGGNFDSTKAQFTGLSIGGQSGRTTRITVDGLDISDEGVGTATMNISQDSIQEFQISRSALDVSTGLTGTGAVNIVTKSGGNEVHGGGFLFWRDNQFAARIGQEPSPFDREQTGFNAGGPFVRDKLFWYANYERNNQDGAVATAIGGFPQFTGTWPIPFDERMVMGRLDWNITRSVRSFVRFTHNFNEGVASGGNSIGGRNLSPFSNTHNANQTVAGLDTATGRFTHSLRFGYLKRNNSIDDALDRFPGLPYVTDPTGRPLMVALGIGGIFGGAPQTGPSQLAPQRGKQQDREFRYDGAFSFGRHTLRWGGLFNTIREYMYAGFLVNTPEVDLNFNSSTQNTCGNDLLCYPLAAVGMTNGMGNLSDVSVLGLPYSGMKNTRFHWYVGDDWRASPRLSIHFGVRYVYEPGQNNPGFRKPALLDEFIPGLSQSARRDKNNYAPHLGLAWDPTGSGKWAIRTGAGLFYDANIFNGSIFERSELIPPGITFAYSILPAQTLIDPNNGNTIFDMTGADPAAEVTPGVNWLNGCADPRFPNGECPLETSGLREALFAALDTYRAASSVAAQHFPSGPSLFEFSRRTQWLYDPNYKTPYAVQFNLGVQRELRPGLVLSVDFAGNRGVHLVMRRDFNRVGAANTLNIPNALNAINRVHADRGCPFGSAGVDCAIAAGASIEDYAANGLGRGEAASRSASNPYAFSGLNPHFNAIGVMGMQGLSRYNALQVALRGRLRDVGRLIRNWQTVAAYSLSRYKAAGLDQAINFVNEPVNNDNLMGFYGPTTLDRTHILSAANLFQAPGGIYLNSIWRVASPLPQSVFVPPVSGSAAEIFYTDFNGDGLGGDWLPGTNRGAFGRSIGSPAELNRLISHFNDKVVGTFTPAAQALLDAGLFTPAQLKALGAVANGGNPLPLAPANQVMLDSFITTDVRISRPFKLWRERVTAEPMFECFNLFNVANYDLASNKLSGMLTGAPGTINGTTPAYRPNRAGTGSGSFAQGIPRSWQLAVRVTF